MEFRKQQREIWECFRKRSSSSSAAPIARPRSSASGSGGARGVGQPGGKLLLFDQWGQRISERTVRSCIEQGWAEPWFTNPLKPDWLVCKLTDEGRTAIGSH
ncbi:MAG: hypothetical protein AB7S71_11705 [Dongiaceae bacterium]